MTILRLATVSATALLLAVAPVAARAALPPQQPPAETGAVAGRVLAPDGAHLPGVVVTVRDSSGTAVARVITNDVGGFRVSGLPPGSYLLIAELDGFVQAQTAPVDVAGGRAATSDLLMALDAVRERVEVIGSAPRDSLEAPRVAESSARDVGEALAAMAGLWKVRRGSIANDIVLRGYQGDNVSVLIDGVRLYGACPNNMDHAAFHVDFAEVDRIEVDKGPFDLKNQGGLGGAVNIVTKRPSAGLHVTPRLSIGSFGYVNPSVTFSAGNRRITALGGYSYRTSDAYRDGAGRPITEVANYKASASGSRAFEVNTGWGRIDLSPAASHAASLAYTRQNAGLVLYPYLQMDALYDKADRVNATYDYTARIGPVEAIHSQAYYTRVNHWMTDERRSTSLNMSRGYSMGTTAGTETWGAKIEAAAGHGTFGVEWYRRGWNTSTELAMSGYARQASIPDVTLTSLGAFGEYRADLGDAVTLDLGARFDTTSNAADPSLANTALYLAYQGASALETRDGSPSGKVRLSYRAGRGFTISGGVGRTVRVPDPQERYFALKRAGSDWVGNPALKPTTNTGVDLQVSYRHSRVYVNGSVYRDALGDFVTVYQQPRRTMVPGVMNLAARSYRNVNATMTGAEVEGVLSLTDRLFLGGDVSTVRGRQATNAAAGITSPYLPEIPPARGRLSLRFDTRHERSGYFAEVEGVYSAGQGDVNSDLREIATPPYATASLRGGANIGPARVVVGVSNLFDRYYVEHLSFQRDPFRTGAKVYEPGRTMYANLAVGF